jgi:hypothetical protein
MNVVIYNRRWCRFEIVAMAAMLLLLLAAACFDSLPNDPGLGVRRVGCSRIGEPGRCRARRGRLSAVTAAAVFAALTFAHAGASGRRRYQSCSRPLRSDCLLRAPITC